MTWRKCEEIRISNQKDGNFLQALGTWGLDWTCAQNNRKLKNVKQERHVVKDGDQNSLPESKTQQAKK